jgi:predicted metal-dependent hydrolase
MAEPDDDLDLEDELLQGIDFDEEDSTSVEDGTTPEDGQPTGVSSRQDSGQSTTPRQAAPPATPGANEGVRFDPSTGNVIDAAGNVVAKSGAERRLWENARTIQAEADRLRGRETELTQQLQRVQQETQALNGLPQRFGLSGDDVQMGLQLMAGFKSDPVGTIKQLLTQARAAGHNIEGVGGNVDTAAISAMIDAKLAPFTQDRETQAQNAEQDRAARESYNAFLRDHEFASVHEATIAQLLERNPKLSPEVAYLQLELWATKNQLDFSQPLAPQLQARQSGAPDAPGLTTPRSSNGGVRPATGAGELADPNASYASIIDQELANAGIT